MNAETPRLSLPEYRVRAKRLLKGLRHPESEEAAAEAMARFRRLRSFSDKTAAQVYQEARLKHALTVVALEGGYGSWRALKASAEKTGSLLGGPYRGPAMYARGLDVFVNRWFVSYEEARDSLEKQGGFLLPYKSQFFVCEEGVIRALGLDPDDPDWQRIGYDWTEPRDRQAWLRLAGKREQALLGGPPLKGKVSP